MRTLARLAPLLALAAVLTATAAGMRTEPASWPKVVFIFADDWGWGDLSAHGHPWLKTPRIDSLARDGISFEQFNVLNPVCSPSRTAALTGHYPARYSVHQHFATGMNAERGMPDWLDPRAPTIAKFFRAAGYWTGHFGKFPGNAARPPVGPAGRADNYPRRPAGDDRTENVPRLSNSVTLPQPHPIPSMTAFLSRPTRRALLLSFVASALLRGAPAAKEQSMDEMWGSTAVRVGIDQSDRVALFRDGNYGMFIHWGLYSHLAGKWRGETFYGIGEWIKRQMKISDADYSQVAREFNPTAFDAPEIVRVAQAAGMKWIIITSKHHDGFAMFKSAHPFNVVDATPFARDPMKELAAACREAGLGFGFYYSHNQDWTAPGGNNGPKTNPDGSAANFEQYFRDKCYPQVKEICTNYGPLSYVWFDTPGNMPKEPAVKLAELVRQTQPNALLCSRVGHGLGDYASKGDMEVPPRNIEGLWETCDTTNDSWAYAWYDQNWKDSKKILHRLVATVARGGTYLLNVGPDGQGRIPEPAVKYLTAAGEWIKRYPKVVYGAGASPWGHAQPWGDVTTTGETLNLVVFDWPQDGRLLLPGLQTEIAAAGVVAKGSLQPIRWKKTDSWTEFALPPRTADHPATVVAVKLKGAAKVDTTLAVHPNVPAHLLVEFAEVSDATKKEIRWMEKFGEWKFANQVSGWKPSGRATWIVDVAEPGDYRLELTYRGEGRLVWRIETDEGVQLQNQQNSSHVYHAYPFGLLTFKRPGKHTIAVSLVSGPPDKASLSAIRLTPAE